MTGRADETQLAAKKLTHRQWIWYPLGMGEKERLAGQEEMAALAGELAGTFIQRRDLYARQQDDGSYVAIKKQLRRYHLVAHLAGRLTLGAYVLDGKSHGRYLVLDADNETDWRRLGAVGALLAEWGTAGYLERSRRGGHLWLFFAEPLPGERIRRFGEGLLSFFRMEEIELFPKQGRLGSGPGSLIRLPFGVHRKSGRRYGFYTPAGEPLAPTLREQIWALRSPETISEGVFDKFTAYAGETAGKTAQNASERARRAVLGPGEGRSAASMTAEQIRAALPVRQFVLRYVELSPGGKGLCPFHDDTVPSFSVNEAKNFWYCFACETGGGVIDFWMRWRGCDFQTAVGELREMLVEEWAQRMLEET